MVLLNIFGVAEFESVFFSSNYESSVRDLYDGEAVSNFNASKFPLVYFVLLLLVWR